MTEAEWLAAIDPMPMLDHLRGKASDRKLWLFAVACCRRIWAVIPNEAAQYAVEVAERLAEGGASNGERNATALAAEYSAVDSDNYAGSVAMFATAAALDCRALIAAESASSNAASAYGFAQTTIPEDTVDSALDAIEPARKKERVAQCSLIKEIFGNPFRPVTLDHTWLTSTVHALAEGIYSEKAFDRMPILADALQDAGCDNEDILNHCRQPGEHCRGCFVVDLVLGKT